MTDPFRSEDSIETFLVHAEGLRVLVRGLLASEDRVDDVLQETWILALRQRAAVNRAWLGTVARRLVSRLHRSERRRERRERATYEEDRSTPSTSEMQEREELRRRLADAVFALPEPYRRAVLLRFFEEREPAEIARTEGVPAATVRTRVHRGLALLRERLDARTPGGREAWRAQLAPLAGASSLFGAGATGTWILGGLLVTALTLAALWASSGPFDSDPDDPSAPSPSGGTPLAGVPAESSVESRDAEMRVVRRALDEIDADPDRYLIAGFAPSARGAPTTDTEGAATDPTGRLEGRVVGVDQQTIERGWTARCMPIPRGEGHTMRFAEAKELTDGRFAIEDLPAGEYVVWVAFDVGLRSDAERLSISAGGTTRVTLTSPIDLRRTAAVRLVHGRRARVTFEEAPGGGSGAWRPQGVRLEGAGRSYERFEISREGQPVVRFEDVEPGEYVFHMDDPLYAAVELRGVLPGGEVQSASLRGSSSVRLRVRDARTRLPVASFRVLGSTEGTVTLPEEAPIAEVTPPEPGSGREPGELRIEGLVAGDPAFEIRAEGHAATRVTARGLEPRESRLVEVFLPDSVDLEGAVLDTAGDPVAGARIGLFRRAAKQDSDESLHFPRTSKLGGIEEELVRWEVAAAVSDEHGRFRMEKVPVGEFVLRAVSPEVRTEFAELGAPAGGARVSFTGYLTAEGLRTQRLPDPLWPYSPNVVAGFQGLRLGELGASPARVSLPACAGLRGKLQLRAGAAATPTWVRVYRGPSARGPLVAQARVAGSEFHFRYLPPGESRLAVVWESGQRNAEAIRTVRTFDSLAAPLTEIGALTLVAGETVDREFDLRASTPVALPVVLAFDGASPPAAVQVLLRPVGSSDFRDVVSVPLGPQGRGTSPWIPPGTYEVAIQCSQPAWFVEGGGPFVVAAEGSEPLQLSLPLLEVSLQCLDADDDRPLANTALFLDATARWKGLPMPLLPRSTDADGLLKATLPAGNYGVARVGAERIRFDLPPERVEFTVSTSGGTRARELRLPK